MNVSRYSRVLRAACVLAIVGLALMSWSLLDPRPLPVLVAMSVGQGFGTLSFAMFIAVVLADLRRARLDRAPRE
jgi:hypothetical protein